MNSTEKVELFSNQITLYSNSFLCFGANEMRRQLRAMLAQVSELFPMVRNVPRYYLFGLLLATITFFCKNCLNILMQLSGIGHPTAGTTNFNGRHKRCISQ